VNLGDDTSDRGRNGSNGFFILQLQKGLIQFNPVAFFDQKADHRARIRTFTKLG